MLNSLFSAYQIRHCHECVEFVSSAQVKERALVIGNQSFYDMNIVALVIEKEPS